ncbi:DoxX family protein [Corynebacterium auriscanis]|uniref:Membrane protein n=1 Tax=Corynebacterium auriscanis TaxID=99807 RepID=A0A0A2DIR9_9CORY|nr:DoxX family protein [Corynebacterium auriscanis]KGM19063.1 membrane protein [Corynebacterium auriscanis]WJY73302.1 DoxX [Corynebacterium auriscanis]
MNHPVVRDTALFILRAILGVVFIAHGWRNVFGVGMVGDNSTIVEFARVGYPNPSVFAWTVSVLFMFCGAMLIAGVLTTAAAGVLFVIAAAMLYFQFSHHGFYVSDGGMEYILVLMASLLMIVVFGAGRASLDRALARFA